MILVLEDFCLFWLNTVYPVLPHGFGLAFRLLRAINLRPVALENFKRSLRVTGLPDEPMTVPDLVGAFFDLLNQVVQGHKTQFTAFEVLLERMETNSARKSGERHPTSNSTHRKHRSRG